MKQYKLSLQGLSKMSNQIFVENYFTTLGESTIKKAKSLAKKIQFDDKGLPLIAGSRGNVYSQIPDSKHGFYCFCIHDNEACEGWKYSSSKICKHIIAYRISQGQTIEYNDKEGTKKEIKL
jgi:hypothetical protein